jgi:hypothetical protein
MNNRHSRLIRQQFKKVGNAIRTTAIQLLPKAHHLVFMNTGHFTDILLLTHSIHLNQIII